MAVESATTAPSRAERKRLELRADIVDAAFDEFAVRGYHQTGIAEIARRAGIGHGTVYLHFEGKRDIVEHVVERLTERVMEALAAENAPDAAVTLTEYREQCARIAGALGRILMDDPRVTRMLLLEATSVDTAMTKRIMALLELSAELVAAYFRNGIDHGYLRVDLDVEPTADATVGMILGTALRFLRTPASGEERGRFNDAAIRLLMEGVSA